MSSARLRELTDLQARAADDAARAQQHAADTTQILREITEAVAEERRRRRHLRGLALVPAAIGGGILAARTWLSAHRTAVASAASGVAVGGAAGILAFAVLTGPERTPPRLTEPVPSAPALPPYSHKPPRVGPPKGAWPTPPPLTETPGQQRPRTSPSGTAPGAPPATVAPTPPDTPPPTPPPTGEPTGRNCRIRFPWVPILRWGLLCTPPRI